MKTKKKEEFSEISVNVECVVVLFSFRYLFRYVSWLIDVILSPQLKPKYFCKTLREKPNMY